MRQALLFLDVDGPLIPFGGSAGEYAVFTDVELSNPLLARVNPALGSLLLSLGCQLIWATTWMEEANESIAPLLRLPEYVKDMQAISHDYILMGLDLITDEEYAGMG